MIPSLVLSLALAAPEATAAPPATPGAPSSAAVGWTGSVSEAEFKALHQLRTDSPGALHGTMVDLAGGKAYLSLPRGGVPGSMPAVVVIQEWWGLNDNVKHWSDRLAAEGYAALAVDLYDGSVATDPDQAMRLMKGVQDDRVLAILQAANAFLASDPRVKATRRGCIGWCFGGHWSLRLAMAAPDLSAAVIYYGRPVLDIASLRAVKAPILGVFGNQDKSITPSTVDQFDQALREAGVVHQFYRYDAPHAFANPSNPQYDEKSAGDAWGHVREFLAARLKPPR